MIRTSRAQRKFARHHRGIVIDTVPSDRLFFQAPVNPVKRCLTRLTGGWGGLFFTGVSYERTVTVLVGEWGVHGSAVVYP